MELEGEAEDTDAKVLKQGGDAPVFSSHLVHVVMCFFGGGAPAEVVI